MDATEFLADLKADYFPCPIPARDAPQAERKENRTMSAQPNVVQFPDTLEDLVHQFVNAKHAEEGARKIRVDLEERILALVPAKEEGSDTTTLANGFKLTTTGKLSYKCEDLDALREVTRKWDGNLVPIKTTAALDETGCKFLRRERPELWAALARVVTVAPAKTSLKVAA